MVLYWYRRWERSQALIILPIALVIAGAGGLILGSDAARSFGNFGGSIAVRSTAAIMLVGGLAILVGMRNRHTLTETGGLVIGAFGAALYGFGTLIGFGTGGIMSGIGWLGIAGVLLERIVFALVKAKARRRIEEAS